MNNLCTAVDSDWGGDSGNQRFTKGFLIAMSRSLVPLLSKKQTFIDISSGEVEYVSLSPCTKDISWMKKLYAETLHKQPWEEVHLPSTNVYVDSLMAIFIASKE